jgi:hypothetical protein
LLFRAIRHLALQWIARGIQLLDFELYVRNTQLQLRYIFYRFDGWPHFSPVHMDNLDGYLIVFNVDEEHDMDTMYLASWQEYQLNSRSRYSRVLTIHSVRLHGNSLFNFTTADLFRN